MASATERLASNFSIDSFRKASELRKRLLFVLGALIVYRIGSYIPLPGIDPIALENLFAEQRDGIFGVFDAFSGGALGRMTIFALNIFPYISASIIMQLLSSALPSLAKLKKDGAEGRKIINQYTRYGTVVLAALQGYGIAASLEGVPGIVNNPGLEFRISATILLTGGTMFLMWLGEQITQRGVGNGISLIIFAGIVANLPLAVANLFDLGRTNVLSGIEVLAIILLVFIVIAVVVFFERAQRRVLVQYPQRQRGAKVFGASSSHLPLKLNSSGVIPPIFASSLLLLPLTLANFNAGSTGFLADLVAVTGRGQPLFLFIYAVMIIFFAFFYTAIVFNPADTAENLRKNGGIIQGIRPGKPTADYLDYLLTRLTVVGALYLTVICLIPEWLISQYSVPFYFGGTSVLIVVTVTMDTIAQIQGHLISHQYEHLIRRNNPTGKETGKRSSRLRAKR